MDTLLFIVLVICIFCTGSSQLADIFDEFEYPDAIVPENDYRKTELYQGTKDILGYIDGGLKSINDSLNVVLPLMVIVIISAMICACFVWSHLIMALFGIKFPERKIQAVAESEEQREKLLV
ncbi:hypothetical protein CAEBREN_16724 [Caenorhabditis brenneri]|uniref:Uncharacterized protein n=1 Tax=Caenorhabditis brenneri TaxID=135651 RepID=G0M8M3_CAEBE|nr:hypothetical protein CAEBREN_16724 [Caenorhabditis brenneri]